MSLSDGLMRNAHSFPPTPDNVVICGFEATPVIMGIFASLMIGIAARCPELQCEPTIATTLASTNLLATLTASDGLHLLSSCITTSLRPSTPPAALISSTARSTPHFSHSAAVAAGPVWGDDSPITMSCASAGVATHIKANRLSSHLRIDSPFESPNACFASIERPNCKPSEALSRCEGVALVMDASVRVACNDFARFNQ